MRSRVLSTTICGIISLRPFMLRPVCELAYLSSPIGGGGLFHPISGSGRRRSWGTGPSAGTLPSLGGLVGGIQGLAFPAITPEPSIWPPIAHSGFASRSFHVPDRCGSLTPSPMVRGLPVLCHFEGLHLGYVKQDPEYVQIRTWHAKTEGRIPRSCGGGRWFAKNDREKATWPLLRLCMGRVT